MRTLSLFLKELRFRPAGFLLGLIAASAVAACIVGARSFLSAHDAETDALVRALEERATKRMEQLRDDARVFSKNLGFNILLLPEEQDAGDLYASDRSTHFFTPEQVDALGQARLATLNHLLPILRYRTHWDTYGGDVILIGVEGEIYIKSPSFQKPIEESIAPGTMHIGAAIQNRLGAAPGDQVKLGDDTFTVKRLLPQAGNADDISLLMNLGDVQRLSGLQDKISGVLALSCDCAAGDLDPIRQEVGRIVKGVQVVEFSARAKARQEARDSIDKGTRAQMKDIHESRSELRLQVARFALLLVSLVIAGAAVFLASLTAVSVRERRTEIAMLRALGMHSRSVVALVLYKAALIGAAGGVFGCLAGLMIGRWILGPMATVSVPFLGAVVGATLGVAVVAAIAPSTAAARTDPADILNQE